MVEPGNRGRAQGHPRGRVLRQPQRRAVAARRQGLPHANYFNVAWQNDNLHEADGPVRQRQGLTATSTSWRPNYPGREGRAQRLQALITRAGWPARCTPSSARRTTPPRSPPCATAKPDAVFFFLPGGMGISLPQAVRPGGAHRTRFRYSARPSPSIRRSWLRSERPHSASSTPRNGTRTSTFQANRASSSTAFQKAYGRLPSLYASQGYDAARLIGSALKATVGGDDGGQRPTPSARRCEQGRVRVRARQVPPSGRTTTRSRTSTCARWSRRATCSPTGS